jgi:hypothetical protein
MEETYEQGESRREEKRSPYRVGDWLTPSNKKEVQSFVSFVNFY